MLALGQCDDKFLDEGGDVVIGDDGAVPLLDAKDGLRYADLHIVLHLDLAGEAPVILDLLAGEVGHLGGEDLASALHHLAAALTAGALTSAGGGEEDALVLERIEERAAHGYGVGLVVIDRHLDVADLHELRLGEEEDDDEEQDDDEEDDHARQDRCSRYCK